MTVAAQLFLADITEEDVMRVIDKLKICKSPGPDKIYPRILKEVKEAICSHFAQFSIYPCELEKL